MKQVAKQTDTQYRNHHQADRDAVLTVAQERNQRRKAIFYSRWYKREEPLLQLWKA